MNDELTYDQQLAVAKIVEDMRGEPIIGLDGETFALGLVRMLAERCIRAESKLAEMKGE